MNARRLGLGLLCAMAAGCLEADDEPRTRQQFCQDWATAACSEETVSACQASDASDCSVSQQDFCRSLIPDKGFSDEKGDECIEAVRAAYEDGDLEDDELATVLRLGPPCDALIMGDKEGGESCDEDADCDTPAGYACVRKSDRDQGSCELPQEVEAGRDCSAPQKTCAVGFFCNGENCIEARSVGAACTIPGECGEDAFCDAGKCAERAKVNEPCETDAECAEGICYEYDAESLCTDRIRLARSEPVCEDLK